MSNGTKNCTRIVVEVVKITCIFRYKCLKTHPERICRNSRMWINGTLIGAMFLVFEIVS